MKLFRKKEEKKSCGCSGNCSPKAVEKAENSSSDKCIKILGSGCAKCLSLENAVRTAIQELGLDIEMKHVTDFAQIAGYGVMSTPALVWNEKVVSYGKVLSVAEVKEILTQDNQA